MRRACCPGAVRRPSQVRCRNGAAPQGVGALKFWPHAFPRRDPLLHRDNFFQTFLSKAKFYTTTQKARMRKRIINITTFQWRRRPHQHFLFGTPIPPTDLRIPSRPPSFYSRVRSAVCSGASLTKPIQNQKNRNKKTNGQRSIRTAVASAQSLSTFFSSCTRVDSVRGAAYSHYSILPCLVLHFACSAQLSRSSSSVDSSSAVSLKSV